MINLNAEQRISEAPVVSGEHSTFDRSHGWTGSFNAGKLNCYFIDEMLPGDVVDLRSSFFCRMTTPFYPVYGDCFIDQYFFGVPLRLVWNRWKEFNGENNTSAWTGSGPASVPVIDATSSHRSVGDLAHQMGVTPRMNNAATLFGYGYISSLPFRAVRLIENEWFRNQNVQAPKLINFSSSNDTDYTLFDLPDVTRAKDLFGTLLPGTQKGNAVQIALSGYMNVYPTSVSSKNLSVTSASDVSSGGIRWQTSLGADLGVNSNLGTAALQNNGNSGSVNSSGFTGARPIPVNLIVDGQHASSDFGINVNDLRNSIALQRTLERWAYSGSRYIESIRAFYHIISPDARQQRPELLAHRRTHVRMLDVTQSAPQVVGQTATPLGTVGAYSKTADNQLAFTASFTEHEYLIGLFCCRHARSYSQGVPALFERKVFSDFYLPTLAHIGQVPVRKYRIFAEDVGGSVGNDILGYADAWDDGYRYFESINCGLLDPAAELDASGDPSGLGAVWTYGDFYKSAPTLSSSWIVEGDAEIKRTLAIQNEDQFIADVWFDYKHTRPMPTHSVPGLMDHF